MKLALLADLHSNLQAVAACLEHAREQRADAYAFLGDLVGYGADPRPILEIVAEHAARGAVVVRGNHDTAAADGRTETMDHAAAEAIAWTHAQLSQAERAFLAGLPLLVRQDDRVYVHASADRPEEWNYVTDATHADHSLLAADATYVFSGHVHVPALYYGGGAGRSRPFTPVPGVAIPVPPRRRWLAIVGSAGQPRDGRAAACYALLATEEATLTFFRVPYDWRAAADRIRAAGLPERLALRLAQGK